MANELIGFASLPADTFAQGSQSGADDGEGNPIEANGRTGPFDGQPVQGFSGVQFAPDNDGAFWFLSDNGFGAQENSTDYLLRIYQVDPNFAGAENGDGSVEVQDFVQLSDPDNLIPFNIVNENSEERLLTGSDFDVESFVFDRNGDIWIGDEFGPYLLHFDQGGTLLEVPIPTPNISRLNTLNGQDPLVIGHRGASGLLPEHTLEAYRVAIAQGADFIEPDLVSTKDGVLIARHEPILDDTTNVAEVFGEDRMSTKMLDGEEVTAYFAEDFTLAEIKQLRAVQQNDFRSQEFNDAFEIPTLQEVIELVQEVEAQTGVQVGIYPETKHPTFFDLQDLSLEEPLIEVLQETGFTDPNRIFIQSFEFENLIKLQGMLDEAGLGDIPLVQLYGDTTEGASPEDGFSVPYDIRYNLEQDNDLEAIYGQEFLAAVENGLSEATTYGEMDSAEFLQVIADLYAEGAGPWKNNILLRESLEEPVDGNDDGEAEITTQLTGEITSFIDDAHNAGLQVHPYTLRNEERFLTLEADGTPQTPEGEFEQLIQIGADGFFTDFPGTGVEVRDAIVADLVKSPQNPTLGEDELANLNRSQGFEGMAFSPDGSTIYPLLEGSVLGDPENSLRIYEFDVATPRRRQDGAYKVRTQVPHTAPPQGNAPLVESGEYSDELVGYYPTEDSHPIGDFTPINDSEFLVIERDNNEGEEAEFKKIFKIDISQVDENGFVAKEEVVDLLNIADPNDLNGDGETTFDFPFVTIEDVVVVDEDTILVANDNNYPFSMGREGDIDNNEVILLDLDKPLNLDPKLGENPMADTDNNTNTETPQAKNVIIMIGDGMGWEMARAAAIQRMIDEGNEGTTLSDFYTEDTGSGLSFQELEKYALATTNSTFVDGSKDNSALEGDTFDHVTGESELREGFEFSTDAAIVEGFSPTIRERINGEVDADGNPLEPTYNPELGFNENPILDANGDPLGGNTPIYDLDLGGAFPWEQGADSEYIKNLYPDSANTATTLYTGVKTYTGAIGVDVFEESVETLGERAEAEGKSFGIVSSVPITHATPAAAAAHVNDRNKYHDDSVVEVAQNGDPALDADGNPIPAEVDEFGHPIPDTDNIFRQIVEETQPAVVLGGGHPEAETEFNYISEDGYNELVNGEYDDVYTFLERGPNAGQTLLETAAELDPDNGERLLGLYGARGQSGNLPWSNADGDYSNTGLSSRTDAERPLEEGETEEEFIATEINENPTLKELTQASLDVLGDDNEGFWVTIEGGDIDWSAHDNNLDNMIGTTLDFADSVGVVQDWIEENGGYEENLLIVTADHDHYFTLNEDFPELLRTKGAEALTVGVDENGDPLLETNEDGELAKVDNEDPLASGHYWGSDPNEKYGWGTHSTRPVPVYYQGAGIEYLDNAVGQGFESYGQEVPGIDGYIDQVHIGEAQFEALGM